MNNQDYCGKNIPVVTSGFVPRSIEWSSMDLLSGIGRCDILIDQSEVTTLKPVMWNDLCSEHDAENFCVYLEKSGQEFTPEFLTFEGVWRRDEWNHYLGFRFIYSLLYGEPDDDIIIRLASQPVDFTPLKEFLGDEFVICLLLAYDEIATTRSYSMDHKTYRMFGHPAFLKWIRLVTRDESFHYNNCMQVIRHSHFHRLPELPKWINRIVDIDVSKKEYQGTFVLDHTGEIFTPDFLSKCGRLIKEYF